MTVPSQFRDLPEAYLAKGCLESVGIECFLGDGNLVRCNSVSFQTSSAGSNSMFGPQMLRTRASFSTNQFSKAFTSKASDYERPRCPKCQSLDVNFRELDKPIAYMSAFLRVPMPSGVGHDVADPAAQSGKSTGRKPTGASYLTSPDQEPNMFVRLAVSLCRRSSTRREDADMGFRSNTLHIHGVRSGRGQRSFLHLRCDHFTSWSLSVFGSRLASHMLISAVVRGVPCKTCFRFPWRSNRPFPGMAPADRGCVRVHFFAFRPVPSQIPEFHALPCHPTVRGCAHSNFQPART